MALAFVMPEKPGTRSSFPHANSKRTTANRLKPLPQQQRRDLALLTQLHLCDRTFIPHNN